MVSSRRFGKKLPVPSSKTKECNLTTWRIGCTETSVSINICCLTSQKSEDLVYVATEAWDHAISLIPKHLPHSPIKLSTVYGTTFILKSNHISRLNYSILMCLFFNFLFRIVLFVSEAGDMFDEGHKSVPKERSVLPCARTTGWSIFFRHQTETRDFPLVESVQTNTWAYPAYCSKHFAALPRQQNDKLTTYLLTYLLTPWSRVLLEKLTSKLCR